MTLFEDRIRLHIYILQPWWRLQAWRV